MTEKELPVIVMLLLLDRRFLLRPVRSDIATYSTVTIEPTRRQMMKAGAQRPQTAATMECESYEAIGASRTIRTDNELLW